MIEIIPYQDRWPGEFEALAEKIRRAAGSKILRIDHIGSTSVPSLAAKDVIDIQLTVSDLNIPLAPDLEPIGFESTTIRADHLPPGLALAPEELEKRYFRGIGRRVHLHVRKAGAFNQGYPLLFRDFLRANPLARDAYGSLKTQLARYFPNDVEAYYDIKDPVCDLIYAAATHGKTGDFRLK